MTYKPGEPNTDLDKAKPFWEEVPDRTPPKYEPPENKIQPPFWDEPTKRAGSISLAFILFVVIVIGAASLWL
jgi:hypothetical protein